MILMIAAVIVVAEESSSASTAGDAPDYSGPSPFRYGGLASLYR